MKTYLVGGAVRDKLLGYPHHERDWVVVGAAPEAMLAAGFKPVGKDFPVFLHPQTNEEYALARTERKTGRGYHGFNFYCAPDVTLEQDLERRDLTINAIAEDTSGTLIDPYGGRQDLERKILRHVSPAFAEDPLRVLRIARFAARYHHLGFRIAAETIALMQAIVASDEIDYLVSERVWRETERALSERNPEIYFSTLQDCDALARLFPPLAEQPEGIAELAQCAHRFADPQIRFAVLLNRFSNAAATTLCERIKTPNDYRDLALLAIAQLPALRQCNTAELACAILEDSDVLRRPQRFLLLLDVAAALQIDSVAIAHLRAALQTFSAINTQPLIARGFSGKALGDELRRERFAAVKAVWGSC